MFKIQDEICLAIVDVLKVKFLEEDKEKLQKRYTDNIEAYNMYQQGIYLFNQLNFNLLDKAINYFNKALEIDPKFAPAFYGLGMCHFYLAYFGIKRTRDVKNDMKNCIEKALDIDENLCQAYDLLGLFNACLEWKWTEAEAAWRRSQELTPYNVGHIVDYSINRTTFKQFDFARKLAKKAKIIDPLSNYVEVCAAFPDFCTFKFERVVERLSKYLKLNPPFWWGLWTLWRTFSLLNRKEEAVDACKKSFLAIGINEVVKVIEKTRIEDAIRITAYTMAEFYKYQYTSPYDISLLFINAGEKEKALTWLEIAIDEVDPKLHFVNCDPDWQNVQNDNRFIKYLKKIGFKT